MHQLSMIMILRLTGSYDSQPLTSQHHKRALRYVSPDWEEIKVQSMAPTEHRDILCHHTVKKIIGQTIHRKSGAI